MTLSVCVPMWNAARFIGEALASVRAQTLAPDELIVVDDGSTDDGPAIAASFGARVVRIAHGGVGRARNVALDEARGELIAWLDADDVWKPERLAVHAAHFAARPEVGLSFCHQEVRVEPGVGRPEWLFEEWLHGPAPVVGTCSMMVRRELFARVGRFDESLVSGEDTDWIVRAKAAGVVHTLVPESLLWRRVHHDNTSTRERFDQRAMLAILRRRIGRRHDGG